MWGNNNGGKKSDSEEPMGGVPGVPRIPEPPAVRTAPATVEGMPVSTANANRPVSGVQAGSSARLGASLHIRGEITGNEDLHIDGSVEGLIQLDERKLTVGSSAKVTADIVAREVVIYGTVKGNLRSRERIEIKKDGSVVGDLTTARIMIEDGAYFKGSIEIDRKDADGGSDAADKSIYARAAKRTGTTDLVQEPLNK